MNPALLAYAVAFVAWVTVLVPCLVFLRTTWRNRRLRLYSFLTEESLGLYYELFFPRIYRGSQGNFSAQFVTYFKGRYGRQHYALPLILLACTAGLGLAWSADWLRVLMADGTVARPAHLTALAAFLGGYSWTVADQLARLRSRDFTPHDIYGVSYRLLIAVPLGLSVAAAFKEDAGAPIAFFLGAFPTHTLFKLMRRIVGKSVGFKDTKEGPNELNSLQGVGSAHAERFEQEGISSIAQLAWTDPVDLALRTNFDFDFVVDCQSQALLWVYFEPDARTLNRFMLRGAMEAAELLRHMRGDRIQELQASIEEAASSIGVGAVAFRNTLEEVVRDPYTQFLCSIWYPDWETRQKASAA